MSHRYRFIPLLVAFTLGLAPAIARADGSPREADAHFKRAVELYNETDYAAALIEFKRAYELAPSYKVLYNLGNAYFQVQDYANALKTFQRYLAEGGAQIPEARRGDVEKDVEKLKARVATIAIDAPGGIEITIDDVAIGTTPLREPVLVSAGRRKIVASKAGHPPVTRVVEIAGNDAIKLSLDIADAPATPASPAPAASAPTGAGPRASAPANDAAMRGPIPVLPWIATGALTAGAVVTGVLALSASSDLRTKLDTLGTTGDDLAHARSKDRSFALATDVLGGAAIVMAGVSIYLTATSKPSHHAESARSLRLRGGPGSFSATLTF